jgi:hypothetical protein
VTTQEPDILRDHAQPAPGLARRQPPRLRLGCSLRDYKEQVWLFTRKFAIDWTNNCSEQALRAEYALLGGNGSRRSEGKAAQNGSARGYHELKTSLAT